MDKQTNSRRGADYTHVQVPFTTRSGKVTTVDEGMFNVLSVLREMGVETQYSCQGDDFGAYVCAFTRGARPVVDAAIRCHNRGLLTSQSMQFMDDWCREGYRQVITYPRQKRPYGYKNMPNQYFSYERDIDHEVYGDRTIVRWPKHRTSEAFQLLVEIQPYIARSEPWNR